jgi:hypothetical protein
LFEKPSILNFLSLVSTTITPSLAGCGSGQDCRASDICRRLVRPADVAAAGSSNEALPPRLFFGCAPGSLLRLRHQGIVDLILVRNG